MSRSQIKSTCAILSALGLAVLGAPPAWADAGLGRPQANPVQKAENLIRPAVVYLQEDLSAYVGDNKGWFSDLKQPVKMSFRCTGFVVNSSGYVATAGHCVDPGAEGSAARNHRRDRAEGRPAGSVDRPRQALSIRDERTGRCRGQRNRHQSSKPSPF